MSSHHFYNYDRNTVFEYASPVIPADNSIANTEDVYLSALHAMPAIRSAIFKVRSNEKPLQAAKGQYYPNLSFFGGITTSYYSLVYNAVPVATATGQPTPYYFFQHGEQVNVLTTKQLYDNRTISFGSQFGNNKATAIGIQLNIPILNGFRVRNNVKQARLNLAIVQLNEKAARSSLQGR